MCGICGFNWQDNETISLMTEIMHHRGPDQSDTYSEPRVSLGHRRLSILDLSERGRQPMGSEDGQVWLVFNGEIYNHRAIRNNLQAKGYHFKSEADTEAILNAYLEYGYRCLEHLNGMFSFCIWDARNGRLFVARDRLGIKPLYYYYDSNSGKLVFASEIKSIIQNPHVPKEIDNQSLYDFLGFEYIPSPKTIFKGIKKLPAGHYITLSEKGLNVVPYWNVKFDTHVRPRREIEAELVERLESSVRMRLESDVPLGVFLSGGIDSSAVVAMMSRSVGEGIPTFSLGYREAAFSEFPFARKVAKHFKTKHTELLIDPVSEDDIEKVIWHLDEPMSEFSVLPFYLICRKAREHITVCLSGEGGDELLIGYDRFKASKFERIFKKIPFPIRYSIIRAAGLLSDSKKKKGFLNSARRFLEGAALNESGHQMRWQYFLGRKDRDALFLDGFFEQVDDNPFRPIEQLLKHSGMKNVVDRELYTELRFMMTENPLMKVDKMSMAHGLEIRTPLLDYEFVEFVNSISDDLKMEGWTTKSIFKSAMKDILPEGIAYRSKHGYSFPIKHWLRKELKPYMEETLTHSSIIADYFEVKYIQKLIKEHLSGAHNHSHILWALMNLAVWHRLFMKN